MVNTMIIKVSGNDVALPVIGRPLNRRKLINFLISGHYYNTAGVLEEAAQDLKNRADKLTKKEQDMEKEMQTVREMYARGFGFHRIDLYQAEATRFKIIDGKIMPSFCSINGMGEKAALSIVEARKDAPFLSIEDLISRTKLSKTLVEILRVNGILEGLSETNQISLF